MDLSHRMYIVTTERYIAYVDLIARSGYIVFRSDYRGHGNSEGEAGGAYSRPDYTVDVLNAVASMKRYPGCRPESHWHVGTFHGRIYHPALDGHYRRYQGWRDLGRSCRFLPGPADTLAPRHRLLLHTDAIRPLLAILP